MLWFSYRCTQLFKSIGGGSKWRHYQGCGLERLTTCWVREGVTLKVEKRAELKMKMAESTKQAEAIGERRGGSTFKKTTRSRD